jgi:uncharacterized membrane protein YfcA
MLLNPIEVKIERSIKRPGDEMVAVTIPLLIHILRIKTRQAIGSSLGITFCAALAGSIGKLFGDGPIAWPNIAALAAGAIAGSQLGSLLTRRVRAGSLRYVLALLIGASGVRMWYQVLS